MYPHHWLQHTVSSIRTSIQSGGYGQPGQVNIVKDFFKEGETSATVTRGEKRGRRKCEVIFLNKLDDYHNEQPLAATRQPSPDENMVSPQDSEEPNHDLFTNAFASEGTEESNQNVTPLIKTRAPTSL